MSVLFLIGICCFSEGSHHDTMVVPPGGEADEEDEIIRCVCNIFRDEGLMIQCEKCEVSQCNIEFVMLYIN